jgi:hypothetical protein
VVERALNPRAPSAEPNCTKCTDDRKDKPKLGMEIIRGAKKADGQGCLGRRQDPRPRERQAPTPALTPIDGGRKLEVRGSIGPSLAAPRPGSASSKHNRKHDVPFQVKKVAVLGAGVMGAQIAAHLVNVKVPVVLFDLPAKEGPKNGIVTKAIEGLKKLKPSPLGVADDAALIGQANYEEHMEQLRRTAT